MATILFKNGSEITIAPERITAISLAMVKGDTYYLVGDGDETVLAIMNLKEVAAIY